VSETGKHRFSEIARSQNMLISLYRLQTRTAQAERGMWRSQAARLARKWPKRLFPLFGFLCHALEKDGRAFYWHRLTGTINFPPPRLLRIPSPLHDERIVSQVEFFTHIHH
jgi:hypothetical protein